MKPLFIALTLLLAQAPSRQDVQTASVEGFVAKLGTGEPVARARVQLNVDSGQPLSLTATTDGGGKFVFENVPPGRYRLSAVRDGYVPAEYGRRGPSIPGNPIVLAAKQAMTDVRIDLTPTGSISGRVYDRFGDPIGNANVQALKYLYQDGRRVLSVIQTASTNDLGEYRLFWMQPGQYVVSAVPTVVNSMVNEEVAYIRLQTDNISLGGLSAGPLPNRTPETTETYLPVYFPGTTDAAGASPIDLHAGANYSGVDLIVAEAQAVNIRGRVVSGAGGSSSGTSVALIQRGAVIGSQGQHSTSVTGDGTFQFRGIAPSSYDLVATSGRQTFTFNSPGGMNGTATVGRMTVLGTGGVIPPALNDSRLIGRVSVEVGSADVENVTIAMQAGFSLSGRIAIDNQSGAAIDAITKNWGVQLRPDPFIPQLSTQAAQVDASGAFTITGITPGDYRLSVNGMPRNSYIKSANLGADAGNLLLHLDGEPKAQLAIEIGANTGSLDVSVQDEKQQPVSSATVVLVPDAAHRQRSELYRIATSDASGHIHLDGVAPGDYKLFAWEAVEPGAWQDPDFIGAFEDSGRTVHVGEGTRASAEVRVIPYK